MHRKDFRDRRLDPIFMRRNPEGHEEFFVALRDSRAEII
jgi:hypothetical protein